MLIRFNLRNIDYKSISFYWTIDAEYKEHTSIFGYIVQISESPNGPWDSLYSDPIYAFGYVDRNIQRGMVDQRLYFRVIAVAPNGLQHESNSVCLGTNESNYLSDYIAEMHRIGLSRLNGYEALHYARRKFGPRCPECYDPIQRKSIKAKCPVCFGTTYKDGYFAPVKIYVGADPQAKVIQKTEYGVQEQTTFNGYTSNDAVIESDDVIIFLEQPGERYIVDQVVPSGLHWSITKQILAMTRAKNDNPIQMLPLDLDAYDLNQYSIFRRDWKTLR